MVRRPTFAPPAVDVRRDDRGSLILTSGHALPPYERALGDMLVRWAAEAPERVFLAEREGDGVREISYRDALASVRSLAAALLARGLSASRPLVALSESSVDHALLALAAMHVGIPVVPVSPAYSLQSSDLAKLAHILALVTPGAVWATSGARFAKALALAESAGAHVVVSRDRPSGATWSMLPELVATTPTADVDARFAALTPDTVAKILFTSGSTGMPKGVVNTQRMLCANQAMIRALWPFLGERPPVVVDWLPWSHTFGGNHNFNLVLASGGTFFVDEGRPMPGAIEKTVRNLRDVAPTLHFNVPRGFDALLPFLESDASFRDRFFQEMDLLFYAAAALPQSTWGRLERVSIAARGEKVTMVSAWGSTETAPLVTSVHFPIEAAGNIGLPAPGVSVKLAPVDDKLELRVKGPNVTPGYFARCEDTAAALDEDGFWKMGDAGRLQDPADPSRGIVFDGRIAENFKLTSGTWVNVGELRLSVISATAPLVADAVITGHDGDAVGALLFPDVAAVTALAGLPAGTPLREIVDSEAVRGHVVAALTRWNQTRPGATRTITRCVLLSDPPSLDADEITDKGYLNQRAVRVRRAAVVSDLHASRPSPAVMEIPG